jgi:hypothetical protein
VKKAAFGSVILIGAIALLQRWMIRRSGCTPLRSIARSDGITTWSSYRRAQIG